MMRACLAVGIVLLAAAPALSLSGKRQREGFRRTDCQSVRKGKIPPDGLSIRPTHGTILGILSSKDFVGRIGNPSERGEIPPDGLTIRPTRGTLLGIFSAAARLTPLACSHWFISEAV